jgi:hypothetical protein
MPPSEELSVLCVTADRSVSKVDRPRRRVCAATAVWPQGPNYSTKDRTVRPQGPNCPRPMTCSLWVYSLFKLYLGFSRFSIDSSITGMKPFIYTYELIIRKIYSCEACSSLIGPKYRSINHGDAGRCISMHLFYIIAVTPGFKGHQEPGVNIITRCVGTKSHTYYESWHRIECHIFTICWGLVLKCYESRKRQHKVLNVKVLRPSKHYFP